MCPIGSSESGSKLETTAGADSASNGANANDPPSHRAPPSFFGALSNFTVPWDIDGNAQSTVRCRLEPVATTPENGATSKFEEGDDVDSLLESIMQLACQGPLEISDTRAQPANEETQHDTGPKSLAAIAKGEFDTLRIDTTGLDLSVAPLAGIAESVEQEADVPESSSRVTADALTEPTDINGSSYISSSAIHTILPLATNITPRREVRFSLSLFWLGLGIATVAWFGLMSPHRARVADAGGVSNSHDPKVHAGVALLTPMTTPAERESRTVLAIQTVESLPLDEDPPKEPAKPAAHADAANKALVLPSNAASSSAAVESQVQPQVELNSDPEPTLVDSPFNVEVAWTALEVVAKLASSCRQVGDPSGTAIVSVTFAPSGRVTTATISAPPFMGTATGGCVATRMRSARIPAFSGTFVTLSKSVSIL